MLNTPGPDRMRSSLTRPRSRWRKASSPASRSSRGAKSTCPPSEETTRWRAPSQIMRASPSPVPAATSAMWPARGVPAWRMARSRGRQTHDAPGHGLEVVEELRPRHRNLRGQGALVEHPRQVGGDAAAVDDGPGHPEAGGGQRGGGVALEESPDDRLEAGEVPARVTRLAHHVELTVPRVEQRQLGLRPADVSREDHRTVSTQRRPATNSSASATSSPLPIMMGTR